MYREYIYNAYKYLSWLERDIRYLPRLSSIVFTETRTLARPRVYQFQVVVVVVVVVVVFLIPCICLLLRKVPSDFGMLESLGS